MKKKICSLILSGGNSQRMGIPKAFLKIGNTTFIEKIVSVYHLAGIEKILVVLNGSLFPEKEIEKISEFYKNLEMVCNSNPERGRFYSIKIGLQELKDFDYCFIQNIDNPFVETGVLNILEKNKNSEGFSVPLYKGKGGHPILISNGIIKTINELNGFDYNLKNVLYGFGRKEVVVDFPGILKDINTKEDYDNFVTQKNQTL